jgi:hypothetical protein
MAVAKEKTPISKAIAAGSFVDDFQVGMVLKRRPVLHYY